MTMWSMKVITLLLICYACLSTVNGKVFFVSKNFHNVLHWDVAEPAHPGEEVLYSVQYNSDAAEKQILIKEECQNITALVCDLTAETPSVHDVHYYAQVYCNGNLWDKTLRFKPIAETILGPPVLSKHSTVSSFHVDATVPLGPNGVSVADIITRSKNLPYETGLVYTLNITEPLWAATVRETTTGQFVLGLKNNGTEYCGYVVYKPQTESGRPESERAHFCVTLPGDPLVRLLWLLPSAALLAAVIATLVVCMCKYVNGGKEKSTPTFLSKQETSTPPRVMYLDRYLRLSKVCIETEKIAETTIQVKPGTNPVRSVGYCPQDNLCQDGTGSSVGTDEISLTPTPEDTGAHSSETYGVVAVQEHNKDDHGGTGPRSTPHKMQALPDEEPDEDNAVGRLRLPTALDANGQLVLLLSQLQSSNDGDKGTPLSAERKPLLSDLRDGTSLDGSEFSDSGCDDSAATTPTHTYCNGHYPPSQPDALYVQQGWTNTALGDAVQKEGYNKQNCFSALLLETQSKDVCGFKTGPKKEEDDGEVEESEVEETRPILLGGWVVHIAD